MAGGEADPSRRYFEYIVVGCGGVGSGAVYWLSRRARSDVLGLEQFKLGHDHGGSQDHSRIISERPIHLLFLTAEQEISSPDRDVTIVMGIANFVTRLAYDDDQYTKLTPDTFKAWEEVERDSGLKLVYKTGGVNFARKGEMDHVVDKYASAMTANNIKFERLTGSQLHAKFPQFETDDSYVALYQAEGGLVDAALANSVHIQLARGNGATVIENCPVQRIDKSANGRTLVYTPKGIFQCRRLVVCAGAWINHVLGSIGVHIPVYITQEQVTYFATPNVKEFTKERYPMWIYQSPKYCFYGLPIHGNSGSKIGIDAGGPVVTPETRTYEPDPVREQVCIEHLQKTIPRSLGPLMYSKTCLYTMPPDRNFVIDTCAKAGWDNVIVCCGAGHIFKFASLVGKILGEMAIDGRTQYDVSKFNIDREALTNPNWKGEPFSGTGRSVPSFGSAHQSKL